MPQAAAKASTQPNQYKSAAQRLLLEYIARTKVSLSAIARETGLRLFAIQKIHKGVSKAVKHDTAVRLAGLFGCTPQEVMGYPAPANAPAAAALIAQTFVAPPVVAPGTASASSRDLPWNMLVRSDFNPRRADNSNDAKEALGELAEDIHERGQLENIVVRPHPKHEGKWEILAGDRRYRAFGLLVKDGRRPADATMIARIVQADDAEARAIAIVENLQRVDLKPTEEGDAFLALTELGWETKHLAARIHKSLAYVQQRITLVKRATPELRKALDKGEIGFDIARVTAAGSQQQQAEIIAGVRGNDYRFKTADLVRTHLTKTLIPASYAAFPITHYKGETRDMDGQTYLVDRTAFDQLQDEAVKAKKKELTDAGWKWVEVSVFFNAHEFEPERSTNKKKAGCLIVHKHTGEVAIEEGLVERAGVAPEAGRHSPKGAAATINAQQEEHERQFKAGQRFASALGDWLKKRPTIALRLYVHQGEQARDLAPSFDEAPVVPWAKIAAASEKELGRIVLQQIALPNGKADEAVLDLAKKAGIKVPAHMQASQ